METFIPPEHSAIGGSLHFHGHTLFTHSHRVDDQWQCDAVRQVQSHGESSAVGKPSRYYPMSLVHRRPSQLSEVMSGAVYLHSLKIVHGDLKGVRQISSGPLSSSLTSEPGKHSGRRSWRCCS